MISHQLSREYIESFFEIKFKKNHVRSGTSKKISKSNIFCFIVQLQVLVTAWKNVTSFAIWFNKLKNALATHNK